ncbi:MAG: glycosyltransferase family 87 protein [Siphonobacter sp.]
MFNESFSSFWNNPFIKSFVLIVIIAYCALCAFQGGDFDVFLGAGAKMAVRQNIYQPPFVKGLQYYYSPFFALLLAPFSYLTFSIPEFLWLLFTTFCLYRTWILLIGYLPENQISIKEIRLIAFITLFVIFRFLLYNYSMIQMTIFLMWSSLESLGLFKKEKYLLGGMLLGFASTTKLLPVLFLPYLFYRGEIKAFSSTVFWFIAFLLFPALFIGYHFNIFLLHEWWGIINPGNTEHSVERDLSTHSLVSLIPVYLTAVESEINLPRNLLFLSPDEAIKITNLIRICFVLGSLYFFRTLPFRKAKDKIHILWECSYLFLVTPLLFPHQQKYAFIYIMPAVVYLIYYLIRCFKNRVPNRKLLLTVCLLTSLVFMPFISSDIIGRYFYDVLQHYKILTIATILLSLILASCGPAKCRRIPENRA